MIPMAGSMGTDVNSALILYIHLVEVLCSTKSQVFRALYADFSTSGGNIENKNIDKYHLPHMG